MSQLLRVIIFVILTIGIISKNMTSELTNNTIRDRKCSTKYNPLLRHLNKREIHLNFSNFILVFLATISAIMFLIGIVTILHLLFKYVQYINYIWNKLRTLVNCLGANFHRPRAEHNVTFRANEEPAMESEDQAIEIEEQAIEIEEQAIEAEEQAIEAGDEAMFFGEMEIDPEVQPMDERQLEILQEAKENVVFIPHSNAA